MRQPETTRTNILKQSGALFNTKGYKATSLSDITSATGLTKGAIYRHFKNKDELEKEALMEMSQIMFEHLGKQIREKLTAPEKLKSIFKFFETYITKPPIPGGCPLLNAAIEVDDSNPALRKQAVKMLDMLSQSVITILDKGIKYGQLKPSIDKEYHASIIIALLEGAIMMSKLRGNNHDIKMGTRHFESILTEISI